MANKDISKIISLDEIDDQFLRLKEILHCEVIFRYTEVNDCNYEIVHDRMMWPKSSKDRNIIAVINIKNISVKNGKIPDIILSEIDQIKNRMENMFPGTLVHMNTLKKYESTIVVYILLK